MAQRHQKLSVFPFCSFFFPLLMKAIKLDWSATRKGKNICSTSPRQHVSTSEHWVQHSHKSRISRNARSASGFVLQGFLSFLITTRLPDTESIAMAVTERPPPAKHKERCERDLTALTWKKVVEKQRWVNRCAVGISRRVAPRCALIERSLLSALQYSVC